MVLKFDVALSFASVDHSIARDVALAMRSRGLHVLFDEFNQELLSRSNLHEYLRDLYDHSQVCVAIVSDCYLESPWLQAEIHILFARSQSDVSYTILPVRISKSPLPLSLKSLSSIDYEQSSPYLIAETVDHILQQKRTRKKRKELSSYHVFPRNSKWSVKRQGATRASSLHETQSDALKAAMALAANNNPSEIIVYRKDGSVASRDFFKAGE
jgi:hypothetical protein